MKPKERAKGAAKRVRKDLEPNKASDRGTTTLYLSKPLYRAFRKECEGLNISPSLVIEDLMREFLK